MRRDCPQCGGDLVALFHHGTFDFRPCGFWRVTCRDCGHVLIECTETKPDCPTFIAPSEEDEESRP